MQPEWLTRNRCKGKISGSPLFTAAMAGSRGGFQGLGYRKGAVERVPNVGHSRRLPGSAGYPTLPSRLLTNSHHEANEVTRDAFR